MLTDAWAVGYPDDGDNEIDAEACGMAVLRALEIVEAEGPAAG